MAQINISISFDDKEINSADALKLWSKYQQSESTNKYSPEFYEISGCTYSLRTISEGEAEEYVEIALWNPNIIKVD